jgi:type II secretory pathway component PulF
MRMVKNFIYKAIDSSGASVSGEIRAESIEMAENVLVSQGYIPSKVAEEGAEVFAGWLRNIETMLTPVKTEQLIIFTKQFRTMLIAGIPILQLLGILENQTENKKLRNAIVSMILNIREGLTLYDAFTKHPGIFSPLYTNMIRAGEQSGTLPDVLGRLVYILEHEHKVKSDIKAALQYPIIVLVALMIAFFVLLTFVIPKFVSIFSRSGLELPLPTRVSLLLYHLLQNYWQWIIVIVVIAFIALRLYYKKTEPGRYLWDALILNVPIMGPLFQKAIMSRFASVFSILQSSGVPVLDSLAILGGTIGNQAITREFVRVRDLVEEGRGISGPLKSARYFPPMVVDMIAIGEESGRLEEMLREVSIHYDDEVEYAVKRLSATIGPILIIGLAAVVGFFALSVFLPMWDLTKIVRKGF